MTLKRKRAAKAWTSKVALWSLLRVLPTLPFSPLFTEWWSYVSHRSSLATTTSSSLPHHGWVRHMLGHDIRAKGQVGSSSKSQTLRLWVAGSSTVWSGGWGSLPFLVPDYACTRVHTHARYTYRSKNTPLKFPNTYTHSHVSTRRDRQARMSTEVVGMCTSSVLAC